MIICRLFVMLFRMVAVVSLSLFLSTFGLPAAIDPANASRGRLAYLGVAMNVAGSNRRLDSKGGAISNIFTWLRKWKTRRTR